MTQVHRLHTWVLKYVPDPTTELGIPFAVLVEEEGTGSFADVRFASNWQLVLECDPLADTDVLDALRREIESAWANPEERRTLLRLMEGAFSNVIQVTGTVATIGGAVQPELERIAETSLPKGGEQERLCG